MMMRDLMVVVMLVAGMMNNFADGDDTNAVFSPCDDAKIKRFDGFTLGLAFSSKESFFLDQIQLSPCDKRLNLAAKRAQFAVFRPKVDEISLLTIDNPVYIIYNRFIFKLRIKSIHEISPAHITMCCFFRNWQAGSWWHLPEEGMQQDHFHR